MKAGFEREFRPRAPDSRWRWPVGILLSLLVLAPTVVVGLLFFSKPLLIYRIDGGVLELRGGESILTSHRRIRVADITETREVRLGRGRRVAGTSLPGLCAGRFSYQELGSVWQVTDCRRDVLLLRVAGEERPVLVSPQDRATFLAALSSGRDGDFSPPPPPQSAGWQLFKIVMALLLLPSAAYVIGAVVIAPARLRYRVSGGELEVQLLVWRRRFRLAGARARRYTPRKGWKWAGTALPGYYAGSFSIDGASTSVYSTAVKAEGVLLEGEKRVFVTPADIPAFLAALREQGATTDE